VQVVEQGIVGDALMRWGPTRFFTPLAMNITAEMREALDGEIDGDALLTGPEFVRRALQPIAEGAALRGRVHEHTRVVAVGRRGLTRGDYANHPIRAERAFRLLMQQGVNEKVLEADVIIDATGGFTQPMPLGAGGLPACGERSLNGEVTRFLGEVDDSVAGKRLLLVGHGHSAANAVNVIDQLAAQHEVHLTWAVRTANRRPCTEVANDPLPERRNVVALANDLAENPPAHLAVKRRAQIDSVEKQSDGALLVTFTDGSCETFDRILAFTGYRPDATHLTEIAVETSPVTEGGARLHRAIANITDCLTQPHVDARHLESGEPNFYFAGSRSYGRARTFLLQTGYAQLEAILERLG
jgi:hypothetical protein